MGENGARCWQVHRYDVGRSFHGLDELLPGVAPDLAARARDLGVRDGQRFMIGPDGRPDIRVNACLGSVKWRNLGERTYRDYTYSVGVWLNHLVPLQVNWWDAVEDDAEEFLFWRVTDPANVARVQTNSFTRDLAGLKKFYRWMSRYGVANPFDAFDAPRALRSEDVKWLDAGGYKRWLDLGIRGMDLSGRPDRWWRGRNEQRDVAFCDGLYSTGLRVSEWASVVLPELPPFDRRRGYYTLELADACAKGGYGHPYWMPRAVMKSLLSYGECARAAAVRRAQAAGRYERVTGLRLVLTTQGTESVTFPGWRHGFRPSRPLPTCSRWRTPPSPAGTPRTPRSASSLADASTCHDAEDAEIKTARILTTNCGRFSISTSAGIRPGIRCVTTWRASFRHAARPDSTFTGFFFSPYGDVLERNPT
ncbi:hypothetical protein ABT126_44480 [Streptomyces sp. NPDC002012]|uniref:hypothetical protein n=1 Tax=Streptomyces sp. NPDC002012 TaxID=3154532 RepID=UPI00331C1CCD